MQIPRMLLLLAVIWTAADARPQTFSHSDTPQIVHDMAPFEKAVSEVSQEIKSAVEILLADDEAEIVAVKDSHVSPLSHFTQLDTEGGEYIFSGSVRVGHRVYHVGVNKKGSAAAELISVEVP